MLSGILYLKLKMMGSLFHYVRTALMGGVMTESLFDLIYIIEHTLLCVLYIGLIICSLKYIRG